MTDVAIDEIDLKINKYKLESLSLLKFQVKKLNFSFDEFYIYFEYSFQRKQLNSVPLNLISFALNTLTSFF